MLDTKTVYTFFNKSAVIQLHIKNTNYDEALQKQVLTLELKLNDNTFVNLYRKDKKFQRAVFYSDIKEEDTFTIKLNDDISYMFNEYNTQMRVIKIHPFQFRNFVYIKATHELCT